MSGTEGVFEGLVDRLQWDLSLMMSSLSVYRCPAKIRDRISKLITPPPLPVGPALESVSSKLLYAIVIADGKIVSLVRPKRHSAHPSDLQIILTTILSSKSIKNSESWIPICLPGYNSSGFLHGYIKFEPEKEIGLVLISGDRHGFYVCKRWAEEIFEDSIWAEFSHQRLLDRPLDPHPLSLGPYSLGDLAIPGLRHFVYKDKKHVQVSFPSWEDDYSIESNRQRLIVYYQKAYDLIHSKKPKKKVQTSSKGLTPPPMKFVLFKTHFESVLGWVTNSYEIYLAVSPLLSKASSILVVHSIVNWIHARLDSLFLTSSNQF